MSARRLRRSRAIREAPSGALSTGGIWSAEGYGVSYYCTRREAIDGYVSEAESTRQTEHACMRTITPPASPGDALRSEEVSHSRTLLLGSQYLEHHWDRGHISPRVGSDAGLGDRREISLTATWIVGFSGSHVAQPGRGPRLMHGRQASRARAPCGVDRLETMQASLYCIAAPAPMEDDLHKISAWFIAPTLSPVLSDIMMTVLGAP